MGDETVDPIAANSKEEPVGNTAWIHNTRTRTDGCTEQGKDFGTTGSGEKAKQ